MLNSIKIRMTVGDILEHRGMKTQEFAERANISYNQALAFRRGMNARIDIASLEKICAALDVSPADLFQVEMS
jgi:DNA-binding Xre family transcriptional regulator